MFRFFFQKNGFQRMGGLIQYRIIQNNMSIIIIKLNVRSKWIYVLLKGMWIYVYKIIIQLPNLQVIHQLFLFYLQCLTPNTYSFLIDRQTVLSCGHLRWYGQFIF